MTYPASLPLKQDEMKTLFVVGEVEDFGKTQAAAATAKRPKEEAGPEGPACLFQLCKLYEKFIVKKNNGCADHAAIRDEC